MSSVSAEIRNRAWVEHRHPPYVDLDGSMWVAEDPITDCAGVGHVRAEAVGNLVSVVTEYERSRDPNRPLLKLPGRVVTRPTARDDAVSSVIDRLRSLF